MDLIASQYDDSFMFADPKGAQAIEKQKFLAALPSRPAFFKALGHKSTQILSLEETRLDDHDGLVPAHFLRHFEQASTQPIEAQLDSSIILFIKDDRPRIVMRLEHEDLQRAMQARGLLLAKQ